jgi:hypothetical protein
MIYLRSPGKMSLWTPGHFRPDFLTVFYILSTISFRLPCIFLNYDRLTNMCYGLPVNVFKGKNQFRTPERITGCPGHLVQNVFVPFLSKKKLYLNTKDEKSFESFFYRASIII